MKPDITAIVVSFNVKDDLARCLHALNQSSDVSLHIVVVDNASREGNAAMVRERFPSVTLIENSTNRGFAAAVNQGIPRATGDVVLINPDLTVGKDTLGKLYEVLHSRNDVGIVGPRLIYPDGKPQPSVKRFPDWFDLFLILTKVPNFFPSVSRVYNGLTVDYTKQQIVDQVMGACFMIRRVALDAVGTFDEGFWLWFEEVDFCKRALAKGWKTLYTPAIQATHVRGASFSLESAEIKQRALRDSIVHYSTKYFGSFRTGLLKPAITLSILTAPIIDALALSKPNKAKDL